jgi:hypothetical protein
MPIFDSELEEDMKDILRKCGTKTATISVRRQTKKGPSEHHIRKIVTDDDLVTQHTTTNGDYVYHVASISKMLVATALIIAVEKNPNKDPREARLQIFRNTRLEPLTRLINEYKAQKISALPEDPTMYDLLVHRKGVPSSNHRLLTPTGNPIMAQTHVWTELIAPMPGNNAMQPWSGYSNINYALVAMAVEAMWKGSIESFVKEILFLPLKMRNSSMGVPIDKHTVNKGRVIDANGLPHDIERPQYRPDGAEAAAFGIYSTASDLDTFFKFIIDTFHWEEPLHGFDLTALMKVLKITYEPEESLLFTPLGLYTNLSSPVIGALSLNRALFPRENVSNYTVTADQGGKNIPVYYMAGSAIGCGCATALHVGEEYSFAVIVLTDTSGPVDAADHILRLVLQRMAQWMGKTNSSSTLKQPANVSELVAENRLQALRKWKELELRHVQEREYPHISNKTLEGVYKGVDFAQRLVISINDDGRTYITVDGPLSLQSPVQLEIYWIDDSHVKMNVPLHLSVDWLDGADWSNTVFEVEGREQVVQVLTRTTGYGKDKYSRVSP